MQSMQKSFWLTMPNLSIDGLNISKDISAVCSYLSYTYTFVHHFKH